MDNLICLFCIHKWEKRGGTRTTGLFRVCQYCGKEQEGVEGRNASGRCITWVTVYRT